jgi:predicted GTPase
MSQQIGSGKSSLIKTVFKVNMTVRVSGFLFVYVPNTAVRWKQGSTWDSRYQR